MKDFVEITVLLSYSILFGDTMVPNTKSKIISSCLGIVSHTRIIILLGFPANKKRYSTMEKEDSHQLPQAQSPNGLGHLDLLSLLSVSDTFF